MVLEGGAGNTVWAVAFHPDGNHFFDGTSEGIRQWRVTDGQEVGKQTGMDLNAISVSMDQKWVVCGTEDGLGASVWDAELQKKVVEVERGQRPFSVDVAPDCTRFATGTIEGKASIWNIATGERLVGPLEHGGNVTGVKFSSDGGRIATSEDGAIRIFDSHNGDQLISIENPMYTGNPQTPITWSVDSQRLFATSKGNKIKLFDSSTGSQLAEWKIHENDDLDRISIALVANNKFIGSITLSPDGSRLVTGSVASGKIIIWDLRGILPDSYLPINVSTSPHLENTTYSSFFLPLFDLTLERKWSSVSVIDSSIA